MGACFLRAGHELVVWNRSPAKTTDLVAQGAELASTPAEAASRADLAVLMLTDGAAVEEVLFALGVAAALPAQAIAVDMSTITPATERSIAERMADAGVAYLDAPVSGGTKGAAAGELTIFVGGRQEDYARAEPALGALGRPHHLGPSGAGQVAKCVNQLIVALSIAAVSEALILADGSGLDLTVLHEALQGGFADSRILRELGRRMLTGDFVPGATLRNQVKDMVAIASEAAHDRLTLPVTDLVASLFADAVAAFGDLDHSALYLELQGRSGLRPPAGPDAGTDHDHEAAPAHGAEGGIPL